MKHLRRLLPLLSLAAAAPLVAQSAVWLSPGPNNAPASWYDPANWDTGVIPNAPDAVAIFPAYTLGLAALNPSTHPGAGPALIGSGDVSLGELRWQLDGSGSSQTGAGIYIGTYTGSGATSATLRLHGAGLTSASPVAAGFLAPTVFVTNGLLEFNGSASAGATKFWGIESTASLYTATSEIRFLDNSTAGTAQIDAGHALRFADQSTAGKSRIHSHSLGNDGGAYVVFSDQAGAGEAEVTIGHNSAVIFIGSATADHAQFLTRSADPYPGGRWLYFRDQSSAGHADFKLPDSLLGEFSGEASADHATFELSDQVGLTFKDNATAGAATITGRGNLHFRDSSTADEATITGYHVYFRDHASAGSATLAPAFDFATSSIEFRDSSTAADATLNLGKLGRVVFADSSDAGRATIKIGSTAAEGLVEIRDDALVGGLVVTAAPGGHGRLDVSGVNRSEVELRAVDGLVDITLGTRSVAFRDAAGNPTVTLAGIVSGDGGIVWDRDARLTIAHDGNTYAGATRIRQGELHLAGGRTSGVELGAGTLLSGQGLIAGKLTTAGTVAPGSSAGTITVEGDYEPGATSALNIELLSATDYDRLVVGGTAALDGTLNLMLGSDHGIVGATSFSFLSAGAVTGRFSAVNTSLPLGAALGSDLVYTGTGVSLAITQKPFAGFAADPAGAALGAHLDATLAGASGDYHDLISHLNTLSTAAAVGEALDALAPDRHAALARSGLLAGLARQADTTRRLAALRDRTGRGFEAFFEASHRRSGLDAVPGVGSSTAKADGGTAGLQWYNDQVSLGVFVGQDDTTLALADGSLRARTDSIVPGVAFQYAGDRYFLNASASFTREDHEIARHIAYPGFDATVTAAPAGSRTDLAVNAGRMFQAGAWQVTPQVGLWHSRWDTDDFTEQGSPAALAVRDWSAKALHGRIGLAISRPAPGFTPTLEVSWLHALSDDHALATGFAAASDRYAVTGRAGDRNLVQAALSLEKRLGKRAVLNVAAAVLRGAESRVKSSLSAGLRWEF